MYIVLRILSSDVVFFYYAVQVVFESLNLWKYWYFALGTCSFGGKTIHYASYL